MMKKDTETKMTAIEIAIRMVIKLDELGPYALLAHDEEFDKADITDLLAEGEVEKLETNSEMTAAEVWDMIHDPNTEADLRGMIMKDYMKVNLPDKMIEELRSK